ncbi:MAG: hypothetical protein KBT12_00670 [Bacteroidales bacterium]|nr:hypothetical protein [Candidatus Physcousia equi]
MVRKKETDNNNAAPEAAEKKATKKTTTRRTTTRRTTKKKEQTAGPRVPVEAVDAPSVVPAPAVSESATTEPPIASVQSAAAEQPAVGKQPAASEQCAATMQSTPSSHPDTAASVETGNGTEPTAAPTAEPETTSADEGKREATEGDDALYAADSTTAPDAADSATAPDAAVIKEPAATLLTTPVGNAPTTEKAADALPPMGARSSVRMPWTSLPLSSIRDFCDLANQSGRISLLNDQQIQQLSYDEVVERSETLERILCQVLDYDIVLSDTNIWIELLVGHTSSNSDPRVNARLQFERQLEFLSKMMKRIGGRFMIMSETYEEVDRFATAQEPVNYKDADWNDEDLCRNVAARLAKRLMLAQQKENRLRIEGICSENHHSAFADPAIIRRTVELFSQGYKVLLLTNDASVGIRSLGMCDDLQRINKVGDRTWREVYEPQRPMVLTMDDLKLLDQYTRQYHFLQMAANRQWMQAATERQSAQVEKPLELWLDGFRAGDRHDKDRKEQRREQDQRREQERKEQQRKEQQRREAEQKAEQERREQERREAQRKADIERREAQRKAAQAATKQSEKAAEKAADVVAAQKEDIPTAGATPDVAPEPVQETASAPETTAAVVAETSAAPAKKARSHRGGGRRRSAKAPKKD